MLLPIPCSGLASLGMFPPAILAVALRPGFSVTERIAKMYAAPKSPPCSYGFVVYQDYNVTHIAIAGLHGLKMGDRTLTVRRAEVCVCMCVCKHAMMCLYASVLSCKQANTFTTVKSPPYAYTRSLIFNLAPNASRTNLTLPFPLSLSTWQPPPSLECTKTFTHNSFLLPPCHPY